MIGISVIPNYFEAFVANIQSQVHLQFLLIRLWRVSEEQRRYAQKPSLALGGRLDCSQNVLLL